MLTRLRIKNFKRFEDADIELGPRVVFVGPNNSGKTTALQALALWDHARRHYQEEKKRVPEKRSGITLNRRELVALPVPDTNLLWRRLRYQRTTTREGKKQTAQILLEIVVEGLSNGVAWESGFEFTHSNEESIRCGPSAKKPIPDEAGLARIAYLPPMSGLASNETRIDDGAIDVRIGEGRTAEVLRNLCHKVSLDGDSWSYLRERIEALFGVEILRPEYLPARGEVTMAYRDPSGTVLDLSSAGRGLQQILLLLAYLLGNPGAVVLLDEPDAHLEILRQRQVYSVVMEAAARKDGQVIAASHSEVILNEAADRDVVVAFVGAPHRIDDRGSQVRKALTSIGFDHYFKAEITGCVLYVEGSTDLEVLRAFARTLGHPAQAVLEKPFVHYVGNQLAKARDHFFGLREAKHDLVGLCILDRQEATLASAPPLNVMTWQRREIENYLAAPYVLEAFARNLAAGRAEGMPLFARAEEEHLSETMRKVIEELVPPIALANMADAFWSNTKASDDFLDRLFPMFFSRLGLPNVMTKSGYHVLASFVPIELLRGEVAEKLDAISRLAAEARPAATD